MCCFNKRSDAHAATYTQGCNAALGSASRHLVRQGDHETATTGAEWVTKRDCSTIHVHTVWREIELIYCGEQLSSECLVDLV
jgi:hypothetical protein